MISPFNSAVRLPVLLVTVCILGSSSLLGQDSPLLRAIESRAELETVTPSSANPYVSYLPIGVEPDYRYWLAKMRFLSEDRALALRAANSQRGTSVTESEDNDLLGEANLVTGLSHGQGPVTIVGTTDVLPTLVPAQSQPAESEFSNNDDLFDATFLSLLSGVRTEVEASIDGGRNGFPDQDYYMFSLALGDTLTVDLNTLPGGPDTFVGILGEFPYQELDFSFTDPYDSDPLNTDAYASASAPYSGTYYVVVGATSGITGDYEMLVGRNTGVDIFSVDLEAGDVLGVASDISMELSILGPDGKERHGTRLALNAFHPSGSPLPMTATGAEVADVAREDGTHYIRVRTVQEAPLSYSLEAALFRPGTENGGTTQTLFLDFNGATINADALFNAGPTFSSATLSPMTTFLSDFGLSAGNESAVISAILATVEENLNDLAVLNPGFKFELLNSRDHADPFGTAGVSRVIVGGTRAQLGRETIGVASSIDPGNFGLEDTAVVLLDLLSFTDSSDPLFANSLNKFTLAGGATKVELVGLGVGSVVAHEIAHFLGSWHTDVQNSVFTIGDSGGSLRHLIGTTDDIFGDGDDRDVDFAEDVYSIGSGLRGVEDQAGRLAFALSSKTLIFSDGFESGDLSVWQ